MLIIILYYLFKAKILVLVCSNYTRNVIHIGRVIGEKKRQ